MIKWLLNYVKTGYILKIVFNLISRDPSIEGFTWKPTTPKSPLQFAELTPTPTLRSGLFEDRAAFWINITKQYRVDS